KGANSGSTRSLLRPPKVTSFGARGGGCPSRGVPAEGRMSIVRVVLAVALAFVAVDARADDLLTVVADVLEHDATLAGSRADVEIGRLGIPRARAGLLPRVDAGWGRTYNRISTRDVPPVRYWQNGWTVSLTQPLFDWERWIAYRQAGTAAAKSELDYARARQALMLRAGRAYFDLLAAADELTRATDYLKAVTELHELTLHRRTAGEATMIDVRETEAQLDAARLQEIDARQALDSRRRAIETLIGRPLGLLARVPDEPPALRLEPDDAGYWIGQAQQKSYPVQIGELDVRDAGDNARRVRAQRYPVVNLTASHTPAGAASGYGQPTTTTSAMVTVSIPIFAGGDIQARLGQALAAGDKANSALLAAVRQAGADTRESFERLSWARARCTLTSRLVQANARALDATQIGYRVGSRSGLDMLRAYETLFASRKARKEAQYEMLSAFLALKANVASLDFDDIATLNGWLTGDAR
ncbi:TPA: TolC family outer membrane protein, partial [Burkholderia aenigmatica]|nr:TolC family outer membrane protein [Burkholderia aenigmatica]HDR9519544.1 TolC family outer membrane protein [Burkholderia aenigmatica]HDR9596574.1 TolC family outer membrane protein [Burkholderia aenigmatica]HDR9604008.1 TolC family outer membrane protein [Burkholderia aenigmatica]HDR9611547.1 TolC family outer membrane protein [Burkholderia aenigmatica]